MQELFKMAQVFWNAVGQSAFKRIPDEFVRIELRSISGKSMRVQTAMLAYKFSNREAFMWCATVPEQYHITAQVAEQVVEELGHLRGLDVLSNMEPGIQCDSSSFRREAEGRNGRDLFPLSRTPKDRGLSPWRPRPDNIGNQKKSALIKEYQVGSKLSGVFLYAATNIFSSKQSPSRLVPDLVSLVSDNSIPSLLEISTDGWDGRKCQIDFELFPLPGAESRDRSYSRHSLLPSGESVSASSFDAGSIWVAFLAPVSNPRPGRLFSDTLSTSDKPSLQNIRSPVILPADSSISSSTRWPAGASAPVVFGFHKVSCITVYNTLNIFSITYA